MDLTELLAFVVKNKASDLHLSSGLPPMIRVHGDVRRINVPAMAAEPARQRVEPHAGGDADHELAVHGGGDRGKRGARVLRLDGEHQRVRLGARGVGRGADAHPVRRDLVARRRRELDHRDRPRLEALRDEAADQGIGHVAAAEEGEVQAALRSLRRSPKIAVPTRTIVAPSAIASSRSSDMPMDKVSTSNAAFSFS